MLVALVGGGQEEFGWRGGFSRRYGTTARRWVPPWWSGSHGLYDICRCSPLCGADEQTGAVFYVPRLVGVSVTIALLWEP